MTKKANIPAVRFKGFSEEWEQRELETCLSLLKDGTHGTHSDVEKGVYLLSAKNIKNGTIAIDENDRQISIEEYHKIHASFSIKPGDILLTIVGTIGETAIIKNPDNMTFQRSVAYLRTNDKLDNIFLYSEIAAANFQAELENRKSVSAQPGIYLGDVSKIPVFYPESKEEQRKIGQLFTRLDALIVQQQRRLEKLKQIKKAMLAKMFPQHGADSPEIRFKGFADAWEQCEIKNICSISTGKSNTQDAVKDGKYPFYVRSSVIERSERYLYDEEAVLTVGDGVGTGKIYHYVNGKYDLHQRVYRMFDFHETISAKYFFYYFSEHFYTRVMQMTAKTSVDSVRYEMIADMDISLPDKKEQEAIQQLFAHLDKLITLHQRKLDKLKQIKKALLAKMFL